MGSFEVVAAPPYRVAVTSLQQLQVGGMLIAVRHRASAPLGLAWMRSRRSGCVLSVQ